MMQKLRNFSAWTLVPNLAVSQTGIIPQNVFGLPSNIFGQQPTLSGTIMGFILLFLQIVGLIAVAMIIYGGFRYVTSAGNDEAAKGAKKVITNSVIGLIVIILSYVLVTIVINIGFGHF